MRRSFWPTAGGGHGGGIIKSVHRAVRAGVGGGGSAQDTFSQSTNRTNTYKSSSSNCYVNSNTLAFSFINNQPPPLSTLNHPFAAATPGDENENDWVCVDVGRVPSVDEVHHALSSLQEVLDPHSIKDRTSVYSHDHAEFEKMRGLTYYNESRQELDWIEPSTSSLINSPRSSGVYDALHLLQTDPSVQRMVVSLSSDASVWEAVMNNEVVRELRDSTYQVSKHISGSSGEVASSDGSDLVKEIVHWILINTKAILMEMVEKITQLFQPPRKENRAKGEDGAAIDAFNTKLQSSFLLSIMVLLVVVVGRARMG